MAEETKIKDGGILTRGGIYYSSIKPKDTPDTLRFEPKSWEAFKLAELGKSRKAVENAQNILVRMGYLEPKFVTGDLNRQTFGGMKRYEYNFSSDTMPFPELNMGDIWEKIKDKLWFGGD